MHDIKNGYLTFSLVSGPDCITVADTDSIGAWWVNIYTHIFIYKSVELLPRKRYIQNQKLWKTRPHPFRRFAKKSHSIWTTLSPVVTRCAPFHPVSPRNQWAPPSVFNINICMEHLNVVGNGTTNRRYAPGQMHERLKYYFNLKSFNKMYGIIMELIPEIIHIWLFWPNIIFLEFFFYSGTK